MDDYTFILFGGGGDREYAGVGFIILSRLVRATIGAQDHGPREAWLAVRASPRNLYVASCYAPQSGRPLEEREHFFSRLSDSIASYQPKGVVLPTGDFNARIGPSSSAEHPTLGPHTFVGSGGNWYHPPGLITNRDLLLEMAAAHSLVVSGSLFSRADEQKVTYHAPGAPKPPLRGAWPPIVYAELDHLLVPTRWAPAVLDYRSHPQAGLATDHFPVVFTIRVKLASLEKPHQPPRLVFGNSTEARS
eukprot:15454521-Alexandrium_andersonii.AAC.1